MLKITKPFISQISQSSSFRCKVLLNLSFFAPSKKVDKISTVLQKSEVKRFNHKIVVIRSIQTNHSLGQETINSFRGKCRKIKFWVLTIRVLENSLERWLLLICKKMSPPSCFVKIFATLGDKSEEFLRPGVDCDEHAINYFRYHYFSVSWLADSGKMHRPSPAPAPRHRQP